MVSAHFSNKRLVSIGLMGRIASRTDHEHIREAWMSNIVSDGCNIKREDIQVIHAIDQEVRSSGFVRPPSASIASKQDSHGRDSAGRTQKHLRGLQYIQGMLKVVI